MTHRLAESGPRKTKARRCKMFAPSPQPVASLHLAKPCSGRSKPTMMTIPAICTVGLPSMTTPKTNSKRSHRLIASRQNTDSRNKVSHKTAFQRMITVMRIFERFSLSYPATLPDCLTIDVDVVKLPDMDANLKGNVQKSTLIKNNS